MRAYLDNAATTVVCGEAASAAAKIMTEVYGNPSSTHTMGREAKAVLDAARADVAAALGAKPEEIFFTSGGSESDNWAIRCGAELMRRRGHHIISSAVEHSAVLGSLAALEKQGFEVTCLEPAADGSVDVAAVEKALREDTILVSLMMVNNETGGVTDIEAVSKLLRAKKSCALLHTDAVQAFLKVPISAKTLGADMISLSGHKLHAPKGVGALYIKSSDKTRNLPPLIFGGAQEGGKRAGTEALPNIAAFAEAVKVGFASMDENIARMLSLKALAAERLTAEIPELVVLSGAAPHILSVSVPGYGSEVLMNYLESRGVFVSKSSACKKGARSYVLKHMGLSSAVIDGALRIGLSRFTTREEIAALCDALSDAVRTLYKKL